MESSLGKKIKSLRKDRKMTQWDLARDLVTASMISQIESDKATPSQGLIEQIATRLGVKPSYFADDVSHKTDLTQSYRRAKQLMDAENYAAALPWLLTLINPVPPQFREEILFSDLAQCYERLGRLSDAVTMYENVARASLEKDDSAGAVHAYYRLGQLERRQDHFGLARMYWQRAAELLRRHPDLSMPLAMRLYANLARVHVHLREFELALDRYRKAAVLAEKYMEKLDLALIHHGMGNAYIELGDFVQGNMCLTEAIRLYDAIRHQRGMNQCHINLGVGLWRLGNHEEAKRHLTWCTEHHEIRDDGKRLANALSVRSACEIALGEYQEAIADATEAIRLAGDTPDVQALAYKSLAEAHFATGDAERAIHCITHALVFAERTDDPALLLELHGLRAQARWNVGDAHQAASDMLLVASLAVAE